MDLTPGPAEDQKRSDEKPLGLLELIPDEAERGQLWANVWEEYDAAYNEWRDNNPGWKAFYTAHHSYALDAALAVFGEALTSAAYRAGREDAAKEVPERVAVAAERLRRDIREAIDVCYGELGGEADTPEDVAGVERAIAHDMARVLDWIAAAAPGTANTERGSE